MEGADESPVGPDQEDGQTFTVRRGSIKSVVFYEISDYELSVFEQGGVSSIALNFAIFLLSVAFASIITITTVDFSSNEKLFFIYFIISVIGIVIGLFLLIVWWKGHQSTRALCRNVRSRVDGS